jgi:pSer/pThr/pTyr-binding forkhead associated (FHA) protein
MSSNTSQFPQPDLKRAEALIDTDTRERYALGGDRITIGRDHDNSICLEHDVYVSGHHAQVYFEREACFVRDLGSRNSTLVNNVAIAGAVRIRQGDVITICRTKLAVE